MKLYPASDKFRHFKRTRALRVNKARTFKYFYDIILKGEYTYADLKKALLCDIEDKEKSSVIENQFKYMQSIASWLNKGIYEGYVSEDITNDKENNIDDRTVFE